MFDDLSILTMCTILVISWFILIIMLLDEILLPIKFIVMMLNCGYFCVLVCSTTIWVGHLAKTVMKENLMEVFEVNQLTVSSIDVCI